MISVTAAVARAIRSFRRASQIVVKEERVVGLVQSFGEISWMRCLRAFARELRVERAAAWMVV